ncbi:unnamed protein product [Lampetra planeri]
MRKRWRCAPSDERLGTAAAAAGSGDDGDDGDGGDGDDGSGGEERRLRPQSVSAGGCGALREAMQRAGSQQLGAHT